MDEIEFDNGESGKSWSKIIIISSVVLFVLIASAFFAIYIINKKVEKGSGISEGEQALSETEDFAENSEGNSSLNQEFSYVSVNFMDQNGNPVPSINCRIFSVEKNVRNFMPLHDYSFLFEKVSDEFGKCYFYDLDSAKTYLLKFGKEGPSSYYPMIFDNLPKGELTEKIQPVFQGSYPFYNINKDISAWNIYRSFGDSFLVQYPESWNYKNTAPDVLGDEIVELSGFSSDDGKKINNIKIEIKEKTQSPERVDESAVGMSSPTGMNEVTRYVSGKSEITKFCPKDERIGLCKIMVTQRGRIFEITVLGNDMAGFGEAIASTISTDISGTVFDSVQVIQGKVIAEAPDDLPDEKERIVDGETWSVYMEKELGIRVAYPASFAIEEYSGGSGFKLKSADLKYDDERSYIIREGAEITMSFVNVGYFKAISLDEWYSQKISALTSDKSKFPSDFDVSVGGDGSKAFFTVSGNDYQKTVYLYNEGKYYEYQFRLKLPDANSGYKETFEKIISEIQFLN